MQILLTGATSGIGYSLKNILESYDHTVYTITRSTIDLDYPEAISSDHVPHADILINCAGHDLGGKMAFKDHKFENWHKILNTNLISALRITQLAIQKNSKLTVINVTSTNNDKYYANNLVYSLSKVCLEIFGKMLSIDHPHVIVKEARIGLTKTNFDKNRHKSNHRKLDPQLYNQPCLTANEAAKGIYNLIISDENFARISK